MVFVSNSCEYPEYTSSRDETLILSASPDTILCNPRMGGQSALSITWTAGTNHGTGSSILYTLDIDMDSTFKDTICYNIGRTMNRTLMASHIDLANTLDSLFPDMKEEQYYTIYLRMRAKVLMTHEEQVSPTVSVVVMRAANIPDLYLVGDATPHGWDMARATKMILKSNDSSTYTWSGKLSSGEFKILTTTTDWYPCYVCDSTDAGKIVYREKEEDYPDFKWSITSSNNYSIEVNTKAHTISIVPLGGELYNHIYMIGDATPGGWSWDRLTELDHLEKNIFVYEGYLNTGQIKFPTEIRSDWSGEMIFAPTPDCTPTLNGKFDIHKGQPDNKWLIPTAGIWSITINITDTIISFVQL